MGDHSDIAELFCGAIIEIQVILCEPDSVEKFTSCYSMYVPQRRHILLCSFMLYFDDLIANVLAFPCNRDREFF